MVAYVVFIREEPIQDPAEMELYRSSGTGAKPGFDMKALAVYSALQPLEGKAPDAAVILQFSTVEEAKAWYYSPEYQARAPHRQKAAEYRGFIVEGL